MAFLKLIIGMVGSIVAFIIAVKLLAVLLAIVGFALKLIWLAVIVGFFLLVAWVIYRLFTPNRTAQI